MTIESWNEFERQILAGKIPSIGPGAPWFTYVRIPDIGGSRAELFGFSFYHLYISDNGDKSYSIRFKDVRHGHNPWQQIKLKARNIDELHQRLAAFCVRSICAIMRHEIESSIGEPASYIPDDPFQMFKKRLSKHCGRVIKAFGSF